MNAYIENRQGHLYTRVHHHPTIQRYTLPYVTGHSKLAHSDWLQSSLMRAVCLCSSVDDFIKERIYLEMTFLVNGYSLLFVESYVQHFFNFFRVPHMRYTTNQTMYDHFRQQWLDTMDWQHQMADELQNLTGNDRLVQLNYLYEFGPRCQFNQQFHQLWSQYFQQHPSLSSNQLKILLTTKHFHSLNALLTKQDTLTDATQS